MKKFLKEYSYIFFLGVMLGALEVSLLNWMWWVTVFGVSFLVAWKADKEE